MGTFTEKSVKWNDSNREQAYEYFSAKDILSFYETRLPSVFMYFSSSVIIAVTLCIFFMACTVHFQITREIFTFIYFMTTSYYKLLSLCVDGGSLLRFLFYVSDSICGAI